MIAGIDISTKAVHICALEEDSNIAALHIVRLDIGRGGVLTRVRRMRDLMPARLSWKDAGCSLIAIERPYSHHAATLAPMMLAYGSVLQLLPPDLPLLEISPPEWRKQCGLPQRGDQIKQAAIRFARDVWSDPPYVLDDNGADAFCIAWAARELAVRQQKGAAAA